MANDLQVFGLTYNDIVGIKAIDDSGNTITYTQYPIEIPGTVDETPVKFIDYDGAVVYEYSASDFLALSAMPTNPSHTGLTAQGWNWTLSDAQSYVNAYGALIIGQVYVTDDGATRIYITVNANQLFQINFSTSVSGSTTIDWGDGNTTTTTGTSISQYQHTYTTGGSYVISILTSSGIITMDTNSTRQFIGTTNSNNNNYLRTCVDKVEIGANITTLGGYAFQYCRKMTSITLPNNVTTTTGNYQLGECSSLRVFICPSSLTTIPYGALYQARGLEYVSFSKEITSIGQFAFTENTSLKCITPPPSATYGQSSFSSCFSLKSVVFPATTQDIGNSMLQNCYALKSVTINGSSALGQSMFVNCYSLKDVNIVTTQETLPTTFFQDCFGLEEFIIPSNINTINENAFNYCLTLRKISIPQSITNIRGNAFSLCYSLSEVHLKPTTPPTLGSSVFPTTNNLVIYVPSGSLSAYQSATNWSTYASYMVEE